MVSATYIYSNVVKKIEHNEKERGTKFRNFLPFNPDNFESAIEKFKDFQVAYKMVFTEVVNENEFRFNEKYNNILVETISKVYDKRLTDDDVLLEYMCMSKEFKKHGLKDLILRPNDARARSAYQKVFDDLWGMSRQIHEQIWNNSGLLTPINPQRGDMDIQTKKNEFIYEIHKLREVVNEIKSVVKITKLDYPKQVAIHAVFADCIIMDNLYELNHVERTAEHFDKKADQVADYNLKSIHNNTYFGKPDIKFF